MSSDFPKTTDRLNYKGSLESFINELCSNYNIGNPVKFTPIEVGYEDCNILIETGLEKYLSKMFSKHRSAEEIRRYITIMQNVVDAGVQHPDILKTKSGNNLYENTGISSVLMDYINGDTFLEMNRAPDNTELSDILKEASKINTIDFKPAYLFDSWAIPNIHTMYEKIRKYIGQEDRKLVESAISQYDTIPVDGLPHCFVHGDFTKANIIKSTDKKIFILDFSVSNWYPRIQELAVIAANLMHSNSDKRSLFEKCGYIAEEYSRFNKLTSDEFKHLENYAIAATAMEFIGANQEKYLKQNDNEETNYWLNLGRTGLQFNLR